MNHWTGLSHTRSIFEKKGAVVFPPSMWCGRRDRVHSWACGLDPQSRHAVWDFIRGLTAQGKTVVLTTHYMEEAEALCDRVGIIDHGRLIALGSPHELKDTFGAVNLEDVFIELTGRRIREET